MLEGTDGLGDRAVELLVPGAAEVDQGVGESRDAGDVGDVRIVERDIGGWVGGVGWGVDG